MRRVLNPGFYGEDAENRGIFRHRERRSSPPEWFGENQLHMDKSDTTLACKIRKGSTAAFEEIYDRYHRQLFCMARSYLKDEKLSEDAVQDIFVKLWEKREHLNPERSIKGYLFTMLKNQLLNTLRNRKKTILSAFSDDEQQFPSEVSTEQTVIYNDYQEILQKGLHHLPDRRREVFELKTLGHSNDQIAKMLVISVHTVKAHYYHGLKFIRTYLKNHAEL